MTPTILVSAGISSIISSRRSTAASQRTSDCANPAQAVAAGGER
jgi:hypothetical protein